MREDQERVKDIQEAIIRIEKYSVRGKDVFFQDELIQTWILHHLQIIGEASRAMSKGFVNNHPEIEWLDIADFRNILVHEYFQVDLDIVWRIVEREIQKCQTNMDSLRGMKTLVLTLDLIIRLSIFVKNFSRSYPV